MKRKIFALISILIISLLSFSVPRLKADTVTNKTFLFDSCAITLPIGFQGPVEAHENHAHGFVFFKKHDEDETSSVIQVNILDGSTTVKWADWSAETLKKETAKAHKAFVKGVEHRRKRFSSKQVADKQIDGEVFLQSEWSGLAQGREMRGVMLTTIKDGKAYCISMQELEPHCDIMMPILMSGAENFRFKQHRGGK